MPAYDLTFKAEMASVIESLLKAGCRRVKRHQMEAGFGCGSGRRDAAYKLGYHLTDLFY